MVNRLQAPQIELPNSISIPQSEILTTKEGKKIHLLKILNAPVFRLELLFWTNLEKEPIKGVYSSIIGTLLKGTTSMSSTKIEEEFAQKGIFREFSTYTDHSSVVFFGLESKLKETLKLIQEILETANFQQDEIRKYNHIRLENLKISKEKTSYWGGRLIKELVFGTDHIMGKAMEESDYQELSSYHEYENCYQRDFVKNYDVVLTCSKNLDVSDIPNYFPQKNHNRDIIDFSNYNFQGKHTTYSLKNSEQATIKLGFPLPSVHDRDFNLLKVANEILGGYFGSRLNKVIREDKGLTYGIYSSIVPFQGGSFFSVTADVKKQAAAEALKEVINKSELLTHKGIDSEEFELVINYLKGTTLSDINNPFHIAEKYRTNLNLGQPTTELTEFYDFISLLNLNEFNEFTRRRFPNKSYATVIVD
jgi:zinc protease